MLWLFSSYVGRREMAKKSPGPWRQDSCSQSPFWVAGRSRWLCRSLCSKGKIAKLWGQKDIISLPCTHGLFIFLNHETKRVPLLNHYIQCHSLYWEKTISLCCSVRFLSCVPNARVCVHMCLCVPKVVVLCHSSGVVPVCFVGEGLLGPRGCWVD